MAGYVSGLLGGYSQINWVGVYAPLPKTLTLFMTEILDFLYPIYDLTKNSIPYLWPDQKFDTLFMAWPNIWYPIYGLHSYRKYNLCRAFVAVLSSLRSKH